MKAIDREPEKPVYTEEDGSVTYEFTQARPPATANLMEDALKWARSHYITDDPKLALALWRYHHTFKNGDDPRPDGGLVASD